MKTDYMASIVKAAQRNGRQAASVAATVHTADWSPELVARMLDELAEAMVDSFPGGPTAFLAVADIALPAAKVGFHCRRRELGKTLPSDFMPGTTH